MHVVVTGDDITQIDPDAQCDPLRIRDVSIPLNDCLLKRYGAGYRFDRTWEFC
jgi:hypothetical protein